MAVLKNAAYTSTMMYLLQNLPYFLVLIGPLVFFHELGHFTVAKLCGVRVLKFSLGFGPKIIGFRRGETEYVIAAIPLGGFVKMWGDDPTQDLPKEDQAGSFSYASLWRRTAIVAAGPVANLVLAAIVYSVFYMAPVQEGSTRIGLVMPGDPAATAGMLPGDEITAFDGQPIQYWSDLYTTVQANRGTPMQVSVKRGEQTLTLKVTPKVVDERDELGQPALHGKIGVSSQYLVPLVDVPDAQTPAGRAGLHTGDEIVDIAGHPLQRWDELSALLAAPGEVPVSYLRDGQRQTTTLKLEANATPRPDQNLRPERATVFSGLTSLDARVAEVQAGSPAALAGLQVGDRLVAVDGRKITAWRFDLAALNGADARQTFNIDYARGAEMKHADLQLAEENSIDDLKQNIKTYIFGANNDQRTLRTDNVMRHYGVGAALVQGVHDTWTMSALTVRGLGLMLTGKIAMSNVGGPVMLFVMAEKSAARGAMIFLKVMALISVNLGVFNLLPVPILDGGHLVFIGAEAIGRRPLPLRWRENALRFGMALLLVLMVVAFKNDIVRFVLG